MTLQHMLYGLNERIELRLEHLRSSMERNFIQIKETV